MAATGAYFRQTRAGCASPLLSRYSREHMVMTGDRLSTDKKLAKNAGIDYIFVLSGEAKLEDLLKEEIMPWRTVEVLGKL